MKTGFEVALGAALGDDLEAGLDESAAARWSRVSAEGDPALPSGAEPLSVVLRKSGAISLGQTIALNLDHVLYYQCEVTG